MEHPESTHPLAAWIRRPIGFATATIVLGCLAFGLAMLLPIGLTAVALAAAGAVGAVAGLLTLLILIVARVVGLRAAPQAIPQGGGGAVLPEAGPAATAPSQADPHAVPAAPSPAAAAPVTQPEPVETTSAAVGIEDQPTQPLVLDLTDGRRHSATR